MEEKNLENWAEYQKVIEEIRGEYGHHEYSIGNDRTAKGKNIVLFRGQQRADWSLKTTLERKTDKPLSVGNYIIRATRIAHELEAYTGINWHLPDYPILAKEIEEKGDQLFGPYLPCYDYLIFLRHHGYPSPLLDWSESPYIAAYFAMCEQPQLSADHDARVAIYVYIESVDPTKSYDGGPRIQVKGPYTSTHKRHFLQKAWYTVASKWSTEYQRHYFCSHHEIFDVQNPDPDQDILIKITLPVMERIEALKDLDDHNINHFTLFQTDDSLVRTLSMREFEYNIT